MRELFAVLLQEALDAEPVDQELDARLGPLDAVRVTVVQRDDRLHHHQELALLDERFHHDGLVRLVAETTAGKDLESEPVALPHRDHREIVQQPLSAVRLAAGEADLELARQLLVEGIAQEMADRAVHVARHVDVLLRTDACERAGGDVADGVAAGLARGEAEGGESAQGCRRVGERNIVDLEVLARRDVGNTILRKTLDHIGSAAQLSGQETPSRHLDADHVHAFLPLPVDAHLQTHGGELVGVHAALEKAPDRISELVDLDGVGKIVRQ